jgi:thymidylate synthase (FAD)
MWYIPGVVGGKSASKKQGQDNNLSIEVQSYFRDCLDKTCRDSYARYTEFLERGVAPEHARMFLHVNHYVHYIATVNLRNLFHFLRLRTHSHTQIESRAYAEAIVELLRPHLPGLMGLFDDEVRILE